MFFETLSGYANITALYFTFMKLPQSSYNWTSLIGAVIAIISLFMMGFLLAISLFINVGSSYLGLVIYIILPGFLLLGLILIPVGMVRRMKKLKREKVVEQSRWPQVNLNIKQHRNAFVIFVISTTVFLFLSAVGTYEAFHYTESVEFCGTLCHEVMDPEYVTYQGSSHARVACVDCHVGSGADWYVRSKLSGLYQVYSVLFKKYPQPIETPISNLRPARETCEECHWPEKFYASLLRTEKHYLADERNTEWDIALRMKIGAEYSALGLQEGIHWHINPDVKIELTRSFRGDSSGSAANVENIAPLLKKRFQLRHLFVQCAFQVDIHFVLLFVAHQDSPLCDDLAPRFD